MGTAEGQLTPWHIEGTMTLDNGVPHHVVATRRFRHKQGQKVYVLRTGWNESKRPFNSITFRDWPKGSFLLLKVGPNDHRFLKLLGIWAVVMLMGYGINRTFWDLLFHEQIGWYLLFSTATSAVLWLLGQRWWRRRYSLPQMSIFFNTPTVLLRESGTD